MPPPIVKTIRDLIYWEYAKLISGSALHDRKNYGFVMSEFVKLRSGQMHPSAILRENRHLVEGPNECAYCGGVEGLEWEHIIPRSLGGPDTIDNQVLACRACNISKSDKCLYVWFKEIYGADKDWKYKIPRIPWGKYLKLLYEIHEQRGTLEQECSETEDIECILRKSWGDD